MKKFLLAAVLAVFGLNAANAQAKFGHVNTQEIVQAMPEFNAARTEIEALSKQYDDELKSMQEEFQKKAEAFDKEQATLVETVKARRQNELQEMYNKIQEAQQTFQQSLMKAQQDKMQGITTKVLDAIKSVGQTGGYVYIMETGGGIPYISTTLSTDVTMQVKAKLGLK